MHKLIARLRLAQQSFWVLPALSIVVAVGCGLLAPVVDAHLTLPDAIAMSGDEDTARTVLAAIVTVGVSVAGVSFSIIAVALVLASQQLSPRVLRSFQRQPLNQAVLALLLATATYALFVLGAVSDETDRPVPELSVTLAMLLAGASLGLFVVFLHHAVRSLNASVVIRRIAAEGHESIANPYPQGVGDAPRGAAARQAADRWDESRCRSTFVRHARGTSRLSTVRTSSGGPRRWGHSSSSAALSAHSC